MFRHLQLLSQFRQQSLESNPRKVQLGFRRVVEIASGSDVERARKGCRRSARKWCRLQLLLDRMRTIWLVTRTEEDNSRIFEKALVGGVACDNCSDDGVISMTPGQFIECINRSWAAERDIQRDDDFARA